MKKNYYGSIAEMAGDLFSRGYSRDEIEDKIASILEVSSELNDYGFHEETEATLLRQHEEAIPPLY